MDGVRDEGSSVLPLPWCVVAIFSIGTVGSAATVVSGSEPGMAFGTEVEIDATDNGRVVIGAHGDAGDDPGLGGVYVFTGTDTIGDTVDASSAAYRIRGRVSSTPCYEGSRNVNGAYLYRGCQAAGEIGISDSFASIDLNCPYTYCPWGSPTAGYVDQDNWPDVLIGFSSSIHVFWGPIAGVMGLGGRRCAAVWRTGRRGS